MKTKAILFIYTTIFASALLNTADASLKKSINAIINDPSQRNVQWGIKIIQADNGKTLYSKNAAQPMIPASNMKLITTAAALHYLGPDFAYQTTVALKGSTLVIIGSGDPLLGDDVTDARYGRQKDWLLDDIAQIVKSRGVNSIEDIIIDTGVFDDQLVHPSWPVAELNRWYACEVAGLNYNANCVDITCTNNSGTIDINVQPQTSFIKIINQVRPTNSGSGAVGAYRTENINTLIVKGRCRKQQGPFKVAIERPAAFFAFLLAEKLYQYDINVTGKLIEKNVIDKDGLNVLKTYQTPLKDCLARSNKDSFGLAAEAMFKTIAAHSQGGVNGSWPAAQQLISNYLVEIGIRPGQFKIDDGSGLSKNNLISPDALASVLSAMYKSSNWNIYKDSLAVGGIDGTIGKYFSEPEYKGKIFGKTGYINSVKSFSGYCFADGKYYIFSIITHGANGQTRQAINDIAQAIIDNS
ncbi:MAG: D-alanyl-D-alanine carboxypeptidase/D-alanyl-D-alanine-endopeptidase [Sedimentisphaerales bacterium]|nr:D-alanyl-D-alanine carboxypeptidase/D-alanyl-D-alanine-endopeptidase [Sedimentisphaerales bacterium]